MRESSSCRSMRRRPPRPHRRSGRRAVRDQPSSRTTQGGLGSLVAEVIAGNGALTRLCAPESERCRATRQAARPTFSTAMGYRPARSHARALPPVRTPSTHDAGLARQHHLADRIRPLQGPILVLGASGFVGANVLRMLLSARTTSTGRPPAPPPGGSKTSPRRTSARSTSWSTQPRRPARPRAAADRLQLRRLRGLLVRDRQRADLPDQSR